MIAFQLLLERMYVSLGNASPSFAEAYVTQAKLNGELFTRSTLSTRPTSSTARTLPPPPPPPSTDYVQSIAPPTTVQRSTEKSEAAENGELTAHDDNSERLGCISDDRMMGRQLLYVDPSAPRKPYTARRGLEQRPSSAASLERTGNERFDSGNSVSSEITEKSSVSSTNRASAKRSAEQVPTTITDSNLLEGKEDFISTSSSQIIKINDTKCNSSQRNEINGDNKAATPETSQIPADFPVREPVSDSDDDDDMLDSDNDLDPERDRLFCRRPTAPSNLSTLAGVQTFQKFLRGTSGERNWKLWMDIERAKLFRDPAQLHRFVRKLVVLNAE